MSRIVISLHGFYNNLTLRYKILIMNILVIIVSLTVMGYFSNNISSKAIIDKAEKSSTRELELIDSNLNTLLSTINDYSKVIATNNALQDYLMQLYNKLTDDVRDSEVKNNIDVIKARPELARILSNVIYPNTRIFAVSVFVNKQEVYSDSIILNSSFDGVVDEKFLDMAIEQQVSVWSDLLKLTLVDGTVENVFAIGKLVIDLNSGNKPGVVILFLSEREISRIYTENSAHGLIRYYITNPDGKVISSRNKSDLNKQFSEIIRLEPESYRTLKETGKLMLEFNKEKLFLSMKTFDKLGWNIISVDSIDEITKETQNIQKVILFVGVLCLFLAFASSYYISYTITKPVQRLTKTMKQIIGGDMSIRADNESSKEIGILTEGFNNLMDKIQKLLEDNLAQQKAKQEFEFKLIQSQIKPHFLYNTLETILSLNKLDRHEDAMQVTKALANFYRLSLNKGNDIIKISDEISLIKDYLYIQRQRYSNYMDFSIEVDDRISEYYVPKLTLQPLVENSIYHGLKYKNNKGRIEIKGYLENNSIKLVVFDDGVGIPEEKLASLLNANPYKDVKEDFGLGSVDRRLKLLYGNEYGLDIQSEIGYYTKVTVTIPVLKNK